MTEGGKILHPHHQVIFFKIAYFCTLQLKVLEAMQLVIPEYVTLYA